MGIAFACKQTIKPYEFPSLTKIVINADKKSGFTDHCD